MTAEAAIVPAPYLAVNVLRSSGPFRRVSSGPGAVRRLHPHAGADFPGIRGEDVLAFAAGSVRGVFAHRQRRDGSSYYDEVSPARGQRVRAAQFRDLVSRFGSGLSVELVHAPMVEGAPFPLHTLVAHLDAADVGAGELVSAAQVVGKMGASGVGSGLVHTHFEVYGGPADVRRDERVCLDPRGFQRWTTIGQLGGQPTDRPGAAMVWPVTWWVVVACFPASGSARGQVGVDGVRPLIGKPPYPRLPDGTPILATGPDAVELAPEPGPIIGTAPAPLEPSLSDLGAFEP